ncbi:MAG: DNA polymerase, partial [Acidobacteriota bacterium]
MSRKRLYLIDGMSHVYRAYYAIRNLSTSKGFPTNAVYGFTAMLRKLILEEKPDFIAVALDPEGPTVRHQQFEQYKATRKPMPDDLVVQIPYVLRVCDALRVPAITVPGYEADDVIGTLARNAVALGITAILVTSDKDMLQLVSDNVLVLDTAKKENLWINSQSVVEKLGVEPHQVPDLLALWGDASDNIPGAPGIGEKGAKELIQRFGSVEKCLEKWQEVQRKSYRESLRDNADQIRISRELATIHQHLPIQFEPAALELKQPDRQLALDLFAELGFRSFMQEFSQPQDDIAQEALIVGDGIETNVRRLLEHPDVYVRTAGEAACVMGDTGPPVFLDLRKASSEALWRQLAEKQAVTKVCWDGKPLLRNFPGMKIDDVMLMAFLLAPHAGDYSLQRWSMEHLRISLSDDQEEGKSLLDSAPGGAVGRRLSLEVEVLRRLHRVLAPQIDQLGLRRLYEEIELPLVPVLAEMELTGIRLRPETLRHLSEGMEGELEQLTGRIYDAAGIEFNINSPKQLGEILFEKLNLPSVKKTRKTKGYSTDQSVLEE